MTLPVGDIGGGRRSCRRSVQCVIIEDVLFVCWKSVFESGDCWHPVLETLILDENVVEVLIEGAVVAHLDTLKHSLREFLP